MTTDKGQTIGTRILPRILSVQMHPYFVIRLPDAFLADNPKTITLNWIDFYRGKRGGQTHFHGQLANWC